MGNAPSSAAPPRRRHDGTRRVKRVPSDPPLKVKRMPSEPAFKVKLLPDSLSSSCPSCPSANRTPTHHRSECHLPLITESLAYIPIPPHKDPRNSAYISAQNDTLPRGLAEAYESFLQTFPEYRLTWILDTLRRTDYSRLTSSGETYVDYMGGSLYPQSLIQCHSTFLSQSVMGNTHSISNSSKLSSSTASEAQESVLSFFDAPAGYTVVFTANCTGALKLVGESYPFSAGSTFVLAKDSHNSVHGIREFARRAGAQVCYVDATPTGGCDTASAKTILLENNPEYNSSSPSLFALTGQSNITNSKNPLSLLSYASSLGYHTLLDAAALAPTSVISLKATPVDAMAISFYKMFGFPTGVGALVVKESFLRLLKRPWFAGGNVDVVQVPGSIVTRVQTMHQQFEDGTINYLLLPAVTHGLRFLSVYLPFLPLRLSCLLRYLISSLSSLRHESTDTPVVRILSRIPSERIEKVGEQSDAGALVALVFLQPSGDMMPNTLIEHAATSQSISLRTGCMCNPGGAAALLGAESEMEKLYEGVTMDAYEAHAGREMGVVRISLGIASSFRDIWKVARFAATLGNDEFRRALWDRWKGDSARGHGH